MIMTKTFDEFVESVLATLQEGYGKLSYPPGSIHIAEKSDADKKMRKLPLGRNTAVDSLRSAMENWDEYKTKIVWERALPGTRKRSGYPVDTILRLSGPNSPRALGQIANGVFIVYWVGTHEEFNSFVV